MTTLPLPPLIAISLPSLISLHPPPHLCVGSHPHLLGTEGCFCGLLDSEVTERAELTTLVSPLFPYTLDCINFFFVLVSLFRQWWTTKSTQCRLTVAWLVYYSSSQGCGLSFLSSGALVVFVVMLWCCWKHWCGHARMVDLGFV